MTLIKFSKNGSPRAIDGSKCDLFESLMGRTFSGFTSGHPCIGARTTNAQESQYAAIYRDMSSVETAFELLNDWEEYLSLTDEEPLIKTCAFFFKEPIHSQDEFATKFWKFVQLVHDLDCQRHEWDGEVSDDVNNENFEFSIAGRSVFTTTLNPQNPRYARKFPYPVWVMNQIRQFNHLRDEGSFTIWQRKIRKADAEIDPSGTYNPILEDHGTASAAHQLAGSSIEPIPFKTNRSHEEKEKALIRVLAQAKEEACPADIVSHIESLSSS